MNNERSNCAICGKRGGAYPNWITGKDIPGDGAHVGCLAESRASLAAEVERLREALEAIGNILDEAVDTKIKTGRMPGYVFTFQTCLDEARAALAAPVAAESEAL